MNTNTQYFASPTITIQDISIVAKYREEQTQILHEEWTEINKQAYFNGQEKKLLYLNY